MSRFLRLGLVVLATAMLATANVYVATAHQWWMYHWDRSGPPLNLTFTSHASRNRAEAEAAIADAYATLGVGSGHSVEGGADVVLIEEAFGNTGWHGLANPEGSRGLHIACCGRATSVTPGLATTQRRSLARESSHRPRSRACFARRSGTPWG